MPLGPYLMRFKNDKKRKLFVVNMTNILSDAKLVGLIIARKNEKRRKLIEVNISNSTAAYSCPRFLEPPHFIQCTQ